MKNFNYFQPTELIFGKGRVNELGEVVKRFGKKCLLVTVKEFPAVKEQYSKVKSILEKAGVETFHFDGVIPNPTVDSIAEGSKMAKENSVEAVVGLGGGSSMDTAKAIAVEATHEGSCWDYLFFKKEPTEKTLPIIAVTTTSGTGSHVTQVAVITDTKTRDKSAIFHPNAYAKVSIVDPELMLTVPKNVTASTGFDVFCHAFESFLHTANKNPMTDMTALGAIVLVAKYLPGVVENGSDIDAREAMAWADTLGGYSISNAGTTLPHGIGMAIGGMYPHVAHGVGLAAIYPAFTRFTWKNAVKEFAEVARIFDSSLQDKDDDHAAEALCEILDGFIKKIGMWQSFKGLDVPEEELEALRDQCMVLPDYENNPRVTTKEEMLEILKQSYDQ